LRKTFRGARIGELRVGSLLDERRIFYHGFVTDGTDQPRNGEFAGEDADLNTQGTMETKGRTSLPINGKRMAEK